MSWEGMILFLPQRSLENEPEPLGAASQVRVSLEPLAALEGVRLELHGGPHADDPIAYASVSLDHIGQIPLVADLCRRAGWCLYDRTLGELVRPD